MKNFTRFALILGLVTLSSSLLAQFDSGVSNIRVSSTPNGTVPANFTSSIYYTLTNAGAALTPNETLVTGVIINGDTAFGPLSISGNIPSATDINCPHGLIDGNGNAITFYYQFVPTEPYFAICVFSFISQGETNPSNNFVCLDTMYVNTGAQNDWSADEIILHEPTTLDGFDLNNNNNDPVPALDSLTATFTNIGNMTYTQRTPLSYRLALAGDTTNVQGVLANDLAPGESTTRVINNPQILPAVPQDSGLHNLCAIVNVINDPVAANNVTCTSFRIIDSYNPFAPGNWPLGQDEIINADLSITPVQEQVLIQGVNNNTIITVTDMQGKVIEVNEVIQDANVNLSERSAGVYVIQATDKVTGETLTRKVAK